MSSHKRKITVSGLIAVVAIVAILAVVLVPLINSLIESSRISRMISTAFTLETAANAYHEDVGSFPDGSEKEQTFQTTEMVTNPNKEGWDGPYLNDLEGISPWGSKMLLTSWDMFLGSASKEYILIVEDGIKGGADIPTASVNNLDVKMDGSVDKLEGKCQFDINSRIFITLITDAYDVNSTNDNVPSDTK